MENEDSYIRYHNLLAEFTARKLPRFYQKYGNKLKVNEKEILDFSQQKANDFIPPVVPIEKYLDTAVPVRKRRFFEAINIGDIVQGRVTDKWADLLYIRILSVYLGPKRWIADLKVKAECDLSECKTHVGSRHLSYSVADFDIGDKVRGVVSSVDSKDWKICISFRRSLLPDHLPFIELGAVNDIKEFEDDYAEDGSYLKHLRELRCFSNPESVNNHLTELGIDARRPCTFLDQLLSEVEPDEVGEKLRERQSTKWSMDTVANGVKLFKECKHEEAIKCFDQALQMHPTNVEALVARGALKANQSMLKSAITDFRQALEIHPSHRNGCKYLCETLVSLATQYEKDRLWKDASRKYKEILEIDANHEEASERVHQIQMMLSQQVVAGKRIPAPDPSIVSQAVEMKSQKYHPRKSLQELLKEKIEKKKSRKIKKQKSRKKRKNISKKRRRHSRSKSTTSSSSDSDSEITESASEKPTSDSEDEWVEKVVVQEQSNFEDRRGSHEKKRETHVEIDHREDRQGYKESHLDSWRDEVDERKQSEFKGRVKSYEKKRETAFEIDRREAKHSHKELHFDSWQDRTDARKQPNFKDERESHEKERETRFEIYQREARQSYNESHFDSWRDKIDERHLHGYNRWHSVDGVKQVAGTATLSKRPSNEQGINIEEIVFEGQCRGSGESALGEHQSSSLHPRSSPRQYRRSSSSSRSSDKYSGLSGSSLKHHRVLASPPIDHAFRQEATGNNQKQEINVKAKERKQQRLAMNPSAGGLTKKHFSTDEIGFINELLSKSSKK